jgi:hypothetical protein
MADWTLTTGAQEHLDEHNLFDHDGLLSPAAGKVIGVSNGQYTQVDPAQVAVATFITSADSPYTVLVADTVVLADSTGGSVTVNLPDTSTVDGQALLVKRIDGGSAVVIQRSGADVIDTDGAVATSQSLDSVGAHWSAVGSNTYGSWFTIGKHGTVT